MLICVGFVALDGLLEHRGEVSRARRHAAVPVAVAERAERREMLVLVMAKERRLRGGARLVDSVGDSCEEELEVLQPQDVEALRVRLEKEGARAGRVPLILV